MQQETVLQGFRNVLIEGERPGSIVWDSKTGFIARVYLGLQVDDDDVAWMDGKGREAYPAFIDGHVHDRHDEPEKEDQPHLEEACIEGGVGTIISMPNNLIPFTHPDQLEERVERWKKSALTVRFNMGVCEGNLHIVAALERSLSEWLAEIKEYDTKSTNPVLAMPDESTQYQAAEAIGKAGRIKVVHAESDDVINRSRRQIEYARELSIQDHCLIRSPEAEIEGIKRVIKICRDTGVRTHVCHVSTPRGLELIADAKAAGLPITCETCPHYWRLNWNHLETMGGFAKMNPALRTTAQMHLMEQYLGRGYVDCVFTDHAPHEIALKQSEKYDVCPSGVPGVQTMGLLTYDLVTQGVISKQRFIDLTSKNAAQIFGFNKGRLTVGRDADIVLIDPQQPTFFTNESMKSKCGWTPFHGQEVSGRITTVVLKGRVVKSVN